MSSVRRRVRRPLVAAVAGLACLVTGPCSTPPVEQAGDAQDASVEARAAAGVQPPADGVWFGVSIDWAAETLAQYAERSGVRPAMAVTFAGIPMSSTDRANVDAAVEQASTEGTGLLLTLEPQNGLGAVTDDVATDLASTLDGYNGRGVPVLVRYAHGMNGSWYPWGQDAEAYVDSFRLVAEHVHTDAPGSAMMWSPSYGGGYPFTGGASVAPAGSERERALDTDVDGDLDSDDDAYAPYYPGDEYVDWVGISLYHWGTDWPWGENEVPQAGKFVHQLRGEYHGSDTDERAAPDFYGRYGEEHGKPVAIGETAAMYAPGAGGADELAVKQAWWRQVLLADLPKQLPQVKLVNWFEWRKHEPEVDGVVDWRASGTPQVASAFTADLPAWVRAPSAASCG